MTRVSFDRNLRPHVGVEVKATMLRRGMTMGELGSNSWPLTGHGSEPEHTHAAQHVGGGGGEIDCG